MFMLFQETGDLEDILLGMFSTRAAAEEALDSTEAPPFTLYITETK